MRHEARFDFRLAAVQRQELAALADATGLTSADFVRLGIIRWLLDRQEVLLRPDCLNQQPSHSEHAASACDGENMSTNYYLGLQQLALLIQALSGSSQAVVNALSQAEKMQHGVPVAGAGSSPLAST